MWWILVSVALKKWCSFLSRLNNVLGEAMRSRFSVWLSGWLYVCDTLVKVFVWNVLITLFLHQFCLNLVQMILGYLHIYGAEEGEVKGHVGVKRSGWNMVMCTTFGLKSVWNVLISLFLHQFCLNLVQMILGYLHIYGAEECEVKGHVGVKRSGGIWSCAPLWG